MGMERRLLEKTYRLPAKGLVWLIRTFPRTTAVLLGLSIVGASMAAAEFYFQAQLKQAGPPKNPPPKSELSAPLTEKGPSYGYRLLPNVKTHNTRKERQRVIYEADYSTDEHARRLTLNPNPEQRTKFLVLFGCSMTFGAGVNDDETFAAHLAQRLPDYHVYNCGVEGYGPQNMLYELEKGSLRKEVPQEEGIFVYSFMDDHARRAIGTMKLHFWWTHELPYYDYVDGRLKYMGRFEDARPRYNWFLGCMKECATWKYFQLDWPPVILNSHLKVTADLINQSAYVARQQFPKSQFCVQFLPLLCFNYKDRLRPMLDESIHIIDNNKVNARKKEICYSDFHYNRDGHELIARLLLEKLPLPSNNTAPAENHPIE